MSAEHALSIIAAGDAHRKVPCCLPACWPCSHLPQTLPRQGALPAPVGLCPVSPLAAYHLGSCFAPPLLLRTGTANHEVLYYLFVMLTAKACPGNFSILPAGARFALCTLPEQSCQAAHIKWCTLIMQVATPVLQASQHIACLHAPQQLLPVFPPAAPGICHNLQRRQQPLPHHPAADHREQRAARPRRTPKPACGSHSQRAQPHRLGRHAHQHPSCLLWGCLAHNPSAWQAPPLAACAVWPSHQASSPWQAQLWGCL